MAKLFSLKIPMKVGTQTGNLYDASNITSNGILAREMVFDDATTAEGSHNLIILDNDANVHRFAPLNDAADTTNATWSAKKITDSIIAASNVSAGTTTSSTLRWSGTAWIEETSFLVSSDGTIDVQGGYVRNSTGAMTVAAGSGILTLMSSGSNPVVMPNDLTMSAGERVIRSTVGSLTLDASPAIVIGSTLATSITLAKATTVNGTNTFTVGTGTATFGGIIAANGGTINSTGALAISPTTTLTLSPTTSLTLNPGGALYVADDMTFNGGARRIFNEAGSLTLDSSSGTAIIMNKDTTFVGDIYVNGGDISSSGALTIRSGGTNTNINLTPIGTGKVVVTPDATFAGDIYVNGGDITSSAALNVAALANGALTLRSVGTGDVNINADTGYVVINNDTTMAGGARTIKTLTGNLTLDSSTALMISKDTSVTGSIYASANLDVVGTLQAGSGNITVTNSTGNLLVGALQTPSAGYNIIQANSGGTAFAISSTLDCGTF